MQLKSTAERRSTTRTLHPSSKCGISSSVTTGQVIRGSIGFNSFYVRGDQVNPFAAPGDSGSLVMREDGTVLGVVVGVETLQGSAEGYVCEVLPVWLFYDWVNEVLEFTGNLDYGV